MLFKQQFGTPFLGLLVAIFLIVAIPAAIR